MKTKILQDLKLGQKVSKVLRETYETVTRRLRDDKTRNMSGARVAQEWLKYAAAFMLIFTLAIGSASAQVSLPFEWTVSAGKSSLPSGVSHSGLGSDYAASNAPYRLKYDGAGDYIQIYTNKAASEISFTVKKLGGASNSTFVVEGCATSNGTYAEINSFTIEGAANAVVSCTTTASISSTYRYFRIRMSARGANVGLGYVNITTPCTNVDVTGGSAVILPKGTTTYTTSDWGNNGAPTGAYPTSATVKNINGYCVTFTNAYENNNANGLQVKASGGVISMNIVSNSGVDVEVVCSGTNGFSIALTGATTKTGQTGTATISTTTANSTLTITKNTSNVGYIKTVKITPKTASCSANPTAGAAQIKGSVNCSTTSIPVETTTGANDAAWGPGSNCTWSDYGFVWSLGTNVATPSLVEATGAAATNCNKVPVGSSGTATSWDGTLAASNSTVPTSFTAGQAYKFRAYGKNNYASGTYQYSDVVTITPRSISLGSPTGGEISAKVNNTDVTLSYYGQTVTIAAAASSHYTFASWTITKEGGGSVTPADASSASTTFTMPDDNVTITATFDEDPYKTVTFYNNSTTTGITSYTNLKVYVGDTPDEPTLTDGTSGDACDATSDKHYGWSRDTWSGPIDTEAHMTGSPGNHTVCQKGAVPTVVAGDPATINYYAVWAVRSGSGAVTKTDEFTYTSFFEACTPTGANVNGAYTDFSSISGSESDAVYAGNLMKHGDGPANCKDYIQMRSKNSNSGIITTTSGGTAKKVTVEWNSDQAADKVLNIYGKSTAYSAASDLYSDATDGDLLGTITSGTSTEYSITGDYEYIGIRSDDGSLYFDEISIDWSTGGGYTYSTFLTTCCTQHNINLTNSGSISGAGTFHAEINSETVTQSCSGNTITLVKSICDGYTVGAWSVTYVDGQSQTQAVNVDNNNQFTMPDYPVTVSLSTTANTDHFIDRLHNTTNYTGDGYTVSGCDQTVPTLSDATNPPSDETCIATHYKFVGWVPSTCFNSNGTVNTGASGYEIIAGGTENWNASGKDYYAVWAEIK